MRHIIIILTLLLAAPTAHAQWNQHRPQQQQQQQQPKQFSPEEFRKNMEGFVKFQAGLTDAEAEKFFPMLAEMQDKQRENTRLISQQMMKSHTAKSEAEYEKILTYILDLEAANNQITRKYYKQFHTILSWEKIYKSRSAVERFNMLALSRFSPGNINGRMNGGQQWQWNPGQLQFPGGNKKQ